MLSTVTRLNTPGSKRHMISISSLFQNMDFILKFIFICIETVCYYLLYPFTELLAANQFDSEFTSLSAANNIDGGNISAVHRLSTVLITGAAKGLGRELALNFAKLGSSVILCDIDEIKLNETYQYLTDSCKYTDVFCFGVDLSSLQSIQKMVDMIRHTLKQRGKVPFVSCIVNNAVSPICMSSVANADLAMIDKQFKVNVLAHYALYKEFLPEMYSRRCGHIVTISSVLCDYSHNMLSGYTMTKSAATQVHRTLRLEIKSNLMMISNKTKINDKDFETKSLNISSRNENLDSNNSSSSHKAIISGNNNSKDCSDIKTTIVFPYHISTSLFEGFEAKANLLFPTLDQSKVAARIVKAVVNAEEEVFIPRQFSLFRIAKIIMPSHLFDKFLSQTSLVSKQRDPE